MSDRIRSGGSRYGSYCLLYVSPSFYLYVDVYLCTSKCVRVICRHTYTRTHSYVNVLSDAIQPIGGVCTFYSMHIHTLRMLYDGLCTRLCLCMYACMCAFFSYCTSGMFIFWCFCCTNSVRARIGATCHLQLLCMCKLCVRVLMHLNIWTCEHERINAFLFIPLCGLYVWWWRRWKSCYAATNALVSGDACDRFSLSVLCFEIFPLLQVHEDGKQTKSWQKLTNWEKNMFRRRPISSGNVPNGCIQTIGCQIEIFLDDIVYANINNEYAKDMCFAPSMW